jgi:hypothetical protein
MYVGVSLTVALLALFEPMACSLWTPEFAVPQGAFTDTPCSAVATNRASDAGMEGEDDKTQHEVFERTYSGCRAWHRAHQGSD